MWLVIISLLCACSSLSALTPILDKTPENVTAVAGETAILPCSVRNKADKKVAWLRGRTPITLDEWRTIDDPRISVDKPTADDWYLQISEVTERDQGRYQCIVNTRPAQRKTVYLKIFVLPFIKYATSDSDVLEGHNAGLLCNADGDPIPNITWYRELPSDQAIVVGSGNTHTIRNIRREDKGIYKCVASNGLSQDAVRHIRINVVFQPTVYIPVKTAEEYIGNNTIICCDVTSNPRSLTYWQKDGKEISNGERYQIEIFENSEYNTSVCLEILSLEVDDFGMYTCIASNTYGRENQTMDLNVINVSPVIHVPHKRIGRKPGEYTTLDCMVKAFPAPSLQFKRWDRVIEPSGHFSFEIFEEDAINHVISLNILSVETSDFGMYTCEAENEEGIATAEIELYEIGDPVFDTTPITISVNLGSQAILPCSVTDLGSNNVMWMGIKGNPISIGQVLKTTDRRISLLRPYEGEWNLQIENVKLSDAGEYACVISTQPIQRKAVTIIIPEPPKIIDASSPRNINATEGSDIQLECYAAGEPLPRISWYRMAKSAFGRDVSLEDLQLHEAVLPIQAISRHSAGTYVCVASNGIQPDDRRKITIDVHYPPAVTLKDANIGEYLGREIMIQCSSQGNPLPRVTWSRHGRIIQSNWKYKISLYQDSDDTLISTFSIPSLELEDFGNYACESYNTYGQITQVANVYPLGSPKILVNDSSKNTRITEGETLGLICSAEGTPKPTITWHKIENESGSELAKEIGGYMVELQDISQNHSGLYECIASNVLGNSSIQIEVQVDVKLQVYVENSQIGYHVGDEVVVECIISGSPEPLMSWKKHNSINATWEYMIEVHQYNDSLRKLLMKIKSIDVDEFGDYICYANNIHSSASKSVHVYNLETTTALPIKVTERTTKHSTQKPGAASGKDNGSSVVQIKIYLFYITLVISTFHAIFT